MVDAGRDLVKGDSESVVEMRNLKLNGDVTLAFKVEPRAAPLKFDLRIDGKPALPGTFLGADLVPPEEMPFTHKGASASRGSEGRPKARPEAPCFLVWHSGDKFGGDTPAKLDQEAKEALRALGYLQ
jgi:hypothetical protein